MLAPPPAGRPGGQMGARGGGAGRLGYSGTPAACPRDKGVRDKRAANTCLSWPGRRFSPPKRLQLPTVTGIKLRGPDGGLQEPGAVCACVWGGGLRGKREPKGDAAGRTKGTGGRGQGERAEVGIREGRAVVGNWRDVAGVQGKTAEGQWDWGRAWSQGGKGRSKRDRRAKGLRGRWRLRAVMGMRTRKERVAVGGGGMTREGEPRGAWARRAANHARFGSRNRARAAEEGEASGHRNPQATQRGHGLAPTPVAPRAPTFPGLCSLHRSRPGVPFRLETADLTVFAPLGSGGSAPAHSTPLGRHLGTQMGMDGWMSCSHAQLPWGRCSGCGGKLAHPRATAPKVAAHPVAAPCKGRAEARLGSRPPATPHQLLIDACGGAGQSTPFQLAAVRLRPAALGVRRQSAH